MWCKILEKTSKLLTTLNGDRELDRKHADRISTQVWDLFLMIFETFFKSVMICVGWDIGIANIFENLVMWHAWKIPNFMIAKNLDKLLKI
jgi:hypothetical protein